MSSIDVLDILEEACAGDDDKHIDVLLAYIDRLEDDVGIIDKISSLDRGKDIIRALEGYASFLQILIGVEGEVEDEDDYEDDYLHQYLRRRNIREYKYDKCDTLLRFLSEYQEQSRKFENSIKRTDYAYGGFMSEDDDL